MQDEDSTSKMREFIWGALGELHSHFLSSPLLTKGDLLISRKAHYGGLYEI